MMAGRAALAEGFNPWEPLFFVFANHDLTKGNT